MMTPGNLIEAVQQMKKEAYVSVMSPAGNDRIKNGKHERIIDVEGRTVKIALTFGMGTGWLLSMRGIEETLSEELVEKIKVAFLGEDSNEIPFPGDVGRHFIKVDDSEKGRKAWEKCMRAINAENN